MQRLPITFLFTTGPTAFTLSSGLWGSSFFGGISIDFLEGSAFSKFGFLLSTGSTIRLFVLCFHSHDDDLTVASEVIIEIMLLCLRLAPFINNI